MGRIKVRTAVSCLVNQGDRLAVVEGKGVGDVLGAGEVVIVVDGDHVVIVLALTAWRPANRSAGATVNLGLGKVLRVLDVQLSL